MSIVVENTSHCLSVTDLNKQARLLLEGHFGTVWVEGEISNFKPYVSGHWYFTLKDDKAQINCAMFKGSNRNVRFAVEDGMHLKVQASVSLYEGRGNYQLIVRALEPIGEGALQKAFEQLKQKLHNQGLFRAEHKQILPEYITSIGIVTSQNGAALRDILTTLKRRSIGQTIRIYPCQVQGKTASKSITSRLRQAIADKPDTIIIARGGGSLEDLWCFNDEELAHIIYESEIPIISGVGHEVDFTIADFTADIRAATPTAAAEIASPDPASLHEHLKRFKHQMRRAIRDTLFRHRAELKDTSRKLQNFANTLRENTFMLDRMTHRLTQLISNTLRSAHKVLRHHTTRIERLRPNYRLERKRLNQLHDALVLAMRETLRDKHRRLDSTCGRLAPESLRLVDKGHKLTAMHHALQITMERKLSKARHQITLNTAILTQVNPELLLKKGYSILRNKRGKIIADSQTLHTGEAIQIKLYKGNVHATVDNVSD